MDIFQKRKFIQLLLFLVLLIFVSCIKQSENLIPYFVPDKKLMNNYDWTSYHNYEGYYWNVIIKEKNVYLSIRFSLYPGELPLNNKQKKVSGKIGKQKLKWVNYDGLFFKEYSYFRQATFKTQKTQKYGSIFSDIKLFGDDLDEIIKIQKNLKDVNLIIAKPFILTWDAERDDK